MAAAEPYIAYLAVLAALAILVTIILAIITTLNLRTLSSLPSIARFIRLQYGQQFALTIALLALGSVMMLSSRTPLPVAATPVPAIVKMVTPTPDPTLPITNALPYSDITEFNEKASKQEAAIDFIKQRYEAWLITYQLLHACNVAAAEDLPLITQALHEELQTMNAPSALEQSILLSANGTYDALYTQTPCASLKATQTSYTSYIQQLKTQRERRLNKK